MVENQFYFFIVKGCKELDISIPFGLLKCVMELVKNMIG